LEAELRKKILVINLSTVKMSSPISYDSLWIGFVALDGSEQHKFFHAALKQLLGKPPRAAKKEPKGGAVGGAPAEPKVRKTNWWTEATKKAMPLLKPVLEETNMALIRDGFKKYRISCVTQFLGSLKEKGELSAEVFPTDKILDARFRTFLVEYGKTHKEAAESDGEAVAASATSVASAGSKASGKSKFSELSPEEQKALRSERAKKAAATRAANKAAKAEDE
jgi:hypothetical protein